MMNRILTVAAILMCTTTIAVAQGQGQDSQRRGDGPPRQNRPGMMGMDRDKMLFAGIDLTDAQKAKIKTIHEKYRTKNTEKRPKEGMDSARKARQWDDTAAHRVMMDKMRAINEEQDKEIQEVLTPEQRERYNKNKAEMAEKMKNRGGEQRGGKGAGGAVRGSGKTNSK